jgi:hypothetical protein
VVFVVLLHDNVVTSNSNVLQCEIVVTQKLFKWSIDLLYTIPVFVQVHVRKLLVGVIARLQNASLLA